MRAMFNKDVPTGKISNDCDSPYQSVTTPDPHIPDSFPLELPIECSIWSISSTCLPNQILVLLDGSAEVENGVIVSPPLQEE